MENTEYHKIQTVWLRDPKTKHKTLLEGEWALPEFEYLKDLHWLFTEKVDGTNIRVHWDGEQVKFGGRTNNAQMPTFLYEKLTEMFPVGRMSEVLKGPVTLYGEGYGAKIQKGGGDYIPGGCSFILFDISAGGQWLSRDLVREIGKSLQVEVVPLVGGGTLYDAIKLVSGGFNSYLRSTEPEGIIMRPKVELLNAQGKRVISKLKLKDFK